MDLEFEEFIKIQRIPSGTAKSARQAIVILKKSQDIGSIDLAKQAALDAILNTSAGDEPREIKRLRLLYKEVYTTDELKAFVDHSFQVLGINQL